MPPERAQVVLFRTATPDDSYTQLFSQRGYDATSIPALGERLLVDNLKHVVRTGAGPYEAAIVTSRRAADAWVLAVREVLEEGEGADGVGEGDSSWEPWSDLSVYCPGTAVPTTFDTASLPERYRFTDGPTAIHAAGLAPLLLAAPPRPHHTAPSKCGTANSGTTAQHRPYLVLTGDKTLPTLTDALAAAGREVVQVKSYETQAAAGLDRVVEEVDKATKWVSVFSPSSAGYVLPLLEASGWALRNDDDELEEATTTRRVCVRVAAIGETTAGFLRREGFRVDAVASTPDAEGLVAAVCAADED